MLGDLFPLCDLFQTDQSFSHCNLYPRICFTNLQPELGNRSSSIKCLCDLSLGGRNGSEFVSPAPPAQVPPSNQPIFIKFNNRVHNPVSDSKVHFHTKSSAKGEPLGAANNPNDSVSAVEIPMASGVGEQIKYSLSRSVDHNSSRFDLGVMRIENLRTDWLWL